MNGIDDDHIGLGLFDLAQNVLHIRFGENEQIVAHNAKTLGAQLELTARFLAGNVEHAVCVSEHVADLHQER